MAKQGELRVATKREKYKVPYYDNGDIGTVESRLYLRISPDGSNIYELPVFPQRVTSYPRLGLVKGSGQDTDWSLNNDKELVFYDSIFFEIDDTIWQNIRKDRYGNNIFYNREQKNLGEVYLSNDGDMQWISPWAVWGVGEYDLEPGYMVMYPPNSDSRWIWEDGTIEYADSYDRFYKADINRSGSHAAIGWYDDSLGRETVSTVEYQDVDGNWWTNVDYEITALSFGRAPNLQRYEEVDLPVDTWVSLNNSNLAEETVAVDPKVTLDYNTDFPEPYIETRRNQGYRPYRYRSFTDYSIDYTNGQIKNENSDIGDGETCYVHYEYGDSVKIYAGTRVYQLIQINASDGDIDWTIDLGDKEPKILEASSDGTYMTYKVPYDETPSSTIHKYDRSGNQVWSKDFGSGEIDGLELDNNEDYLYFSDDDGYVKKIDLSDQSIEWETQFSEYVGSPSLDYNDSFLYVPEHSGESSNCVNEVNISTGSIIREYCIEKDYISIPKNLTIPPVGDPENPLDFVSKL